MEFLYNYGISQEDALSECNALDLRESDSLLCIASAGEIPLSLSAMENVNITAVDVAPAQLSLCRIKQVAALNADAVTAASFLGFMDMKADKRQELFHDAILPYLPEDDRKYWIANPAAIEGGVINSGRFEQFMQKVAGIGRLIVGKKNLYSLFECNSIEEQQVVFDKQDQRPGCERHFQDRLSSMDL